MVSEEQPSTIDENYKKRIHIILILNCSFSEFHVVFNRGPFQAMNYYIIINMYIHIYKAKATSELLCSGKFSLYISFKFQKHFFVSLLKLQTQKNSDVNSVQLNL